MAISASLLHRERTGEATEVDVSLLSSAAWASGALIAQVAETGVLKRKGERNNRLTTICVRKIT